MPERRAQARVPSSPDVALAISSIDSVRNIARIIIDSGDKAAKPFCSNLRNALTGVKRELENQHQSQDKAQPEKVKSLLKNLERLCNFPRSNQQSQPNRWPTLKALQYAQPREEARRCIRNVAVDPRRQDYRADAIKKLKNYSAATWKQEAAEVAQNNDASATSPAPHKRHELDEEIKSLYKILQQYRSCQNGSSPGEIVTNLRLNGYRNIVAGGASVKFWVENASAEFGVLFLDHPHKYQSFWQEASIQTCPEAPLPDLEVPAIQVTDEDLAPGAMDILATATIAEHSCIPFEGFCERISHRDQDLLHLSTRDDKLVYHRRGDVSREWLAHSEAVSLASIFARSYPYPYLPDKSKAILGLLAAKATWQFYDSNILAQGLTSESVQFICEKRSGKTGVFVDEPMLLIQHTKQDVTSTGDGKSDNPLATPSTAMIHDMPRILALGILLLEIETQKPMSEYREDDRLRPPGAFGINTDYKIARKLIATDPNSSESIIPDIEPLSPLRKILPLCITEGSLKSKIRENLSARCLAKSASEINEPNALRSVIYSELVRPLEDWANRYENFDSIKPVYQVSDAPAEPRPERSSNQRETASQANPPADAAENELRGKSQLWFEWYDKLRKVLQPGSRATKSSHEAVKIAILDTGITQDLYDDYESDPYTITKYKDFVDKAGPDKSTTGDLTGHGSTAAMLVVRMCPNASIYVARVLERNVAIRDDVNLIVEGIDWAISQEVDIITMAIGFEKEQIAVVEAIGRAHKKDILIFSAASNRGNLDNVCCPANLINQVFGICSTNARNCPSGELNPEPLHNSFAIFGENVEVVEDGELRCGTSYSTSIAAGLAATLLDFSRQDRVKDDRSMLSRLNSHLHMWHVFRKMSKYKDGYYCLRPWVLLKTDDLYGVEEQRAWIRGTIERVLQPENLGQARPGGAG
ncbi:hypothetical protein RB601_009781 [Gaeumannomyces tritici]